MGESCSVGVDAGGHVLAVSPATGEAAGAGLGAGVGGRARMTTLGRPFCWPCRHYRPPEYPPGMIKGDWSNGTCAAFPEGIPSLITAGGFDHREPHPDDNGVRFETADQDRTGWNDEQVQDFLNHSLQRFRQRQSRARALGTEMG